MDNSRCVVTAYVIIGWMSRKFRPNETPVLKKTRLSRSYIFTKRTIFII